MQTGWKTFTGMHKLAFKGIGLGLSVLGGVASVFGGILDSKKLKGLGEAIANLHNNVWKYISNRVKQAKNAVVKAFRGLGTSFNYDNRKTNLENINKNINDMVETKIDEINRKTTREKRVILERYREKLEDRKQSMQIAVNNYVESINSRQDIDQATKDNLINAFVEQSERQYQTYEAQQNSSLSADMEAIARNTEASISQARQQGAELQARISSNEGIYDGETLNSMANKTTREELIEIIDRTEHEYNN